jgi:phosphatidate cytidylyltransferase
VRAQISPRVVSAAVLLPAAVAAAYLGGIYFAALVLVFVAVMIWEWARLVGDGRFGGEGAVLMAAAAAAFAVTVALGAGWGLIAAAVAAFAAGAVLKAMNASHPQWAGAGILYITVPAVAMVWLRADPESGRAMILWLFAIVWASDTGAYLAGRRFGGPLLAPAISPRKTWSGAAGGFAASLCIGILAVPFAAPGQAGALIAASAVLGAVAQLGDLFESAVKRRFGVKDTSDIIPGHGGVLDRVDGLLAAAPVAAACVWSGVFSPWP